MLERTILILSYWGINDVLTASTVLVHAGIIAQLSKGIRIVLVTVERDGAEISEESHLRNGAAFRHRPVYSRNYAVNLVNKISDFLVFPEQIQQIAVEERVSSIVAIGTPAGALALQVHKKSNIPFYVAFYEPHAAYMRDTGVWKPYDPRYIFQRKWEKQQALAAAGLLVVSKLYQEKLAMQLQLPLHKIRLARNTVTATGFHFSALERDKVRRFLGFAQSAVVGIYVGKYGGLYYKEEAFAIYQYCFRTIPGFRLIILSPQPKQEIEGLLQHKDIDLSKVFVATVPHAEVPKYLSAADFAFATIKSYPSARFCSPVKVGEYWAHGLPVLLTEGVGDDSDIIQKEGGGATFNLQQQGDLKQALGKIQQILKDPNHRQEIPKLAEKYRSADRVREAYTYFLGQEKEVGT